MRKLLTLFPCDDAFYERLRTILDDEWTVISYPHGYIGENLNRDLEDAEVIFGDPDPNLVPLMKKIRWIQSPWVGTDSYDGCAFPDNMVLTNTRGAAADTMAEHAMAMAFALSRRFPQIDRQDPEKPKDPGCEKLLRGCCAFFFGIGNVGCRIGAMCRALGMRTTGVYRRGKKAEAPFDEIISMRAALEDPSSADYIFSTLPQTDETRGMFSKELFRRMKKGAVLINISRDGLVVFSDVLEALETGKLFGAGIDLTGNIDLTGYGDRVKPLNLILTPHTAGNGIGHLPEVENRIREAFLNNLPKYLAGSLTVE